MSDIQEKIMDKLKRYEHFDSRIGEETVCLDDDVSALEAENERLKAVLESIKDQCIGEVTMGYRLDAEGIGQQIHAAIKHKT